MSPVYSYEIHTAHLIKLQSLYRQHSTDWPGRLFNTRLFCLCVRYHFYLCSRNQGACPASFFELIQQRLGVGHECFASAFNATLPGYHSAHPDLERCFGSAGSFYCHPAHGGFDPYEGATSCPLVNLSGTLRLNVRTTAVCVQGPSRRTRHSARDRCWSWPGHLRGC